MRRRLQILDLCAACAALIGVAHAAPDETSGVASNPFGGVLGPVWQGQAQVGEGVMSGTTAQIIPMFETPPVAPTQSPAGQYLFKSVVAEKIECVIRVDDDALALRFDGGDQLILQLWRASNLSLTCPVVERGRPYAPFIPGARYYFYRDGDIVLRRANQQ